jgi:hypothetical protein
MYFDTSLKTSRVDWSVLSSEEMDGNDGTREDTEDITMLLKSEEVMCAIPAGTVDRD